MRAGANTVGGSVRSALSERKNDLYETPAQATEALLRVQPLPHLVWEPAAGRKAIANILSDAGHDVVCTDLVDYGCDGVQHGVDFLMEYQPFFNADCIVTNPPYKNADAFVRKGLELCGTVIMLLRWAYAEGVNRSDIIDNHLSHIWLGRERLPMMNRDEWGGEKLSTSAMPFAWFVFDREPKTPGKIEVQRMSWRGP